MQKTTLRITTTLLMLCVTAGVSAGWEVIKEIALPKCTLSKKALQHTEIYNALARGATAGMAQTLMHPEGSTGADPEYVALSHYINTRAKFESSRQEKVRDNALSVLISMPFKNMGAVVTVGENNPAFLVSVATEEKTKEYTHTTFREQFWNAVSASPVGKTRVGTNIATLLQKEENTSHTLPLHVELVAGKGRAAGSTFRLLGLIDTESDKARYAHAFRLLDSTVCTGESVQLLYDAMRAEVQNLRFADRATQDLVTKTLKAIPVDPSDMVIDADAAIEVSATVVTRGIKPRKNTDEEQTAAPKKRRGKNASVADDSKTEEAVTQSARRRRTTKNSIKKETGTAEALA